ncbi:1,2-dihydroxy-3-keto-5-methylthiopentene dioxygenase [Marasmius sp. AFHP31]|nr:1,2-dihydroxy-3-keto-5-methylthiopentene dioxygenase [Marasmius sp. AFHP31]
MSLRAYYRDTCPTPGDLNLPLDSGRPVSEEKLRALGMKWWSVEGSLDEQMKTFKELSKTLGFQEGDYEHLYDLSQATGSPYDLAMAPKDVLESWGKDNLFLPPTFVLYLGGNIYIDFKEPGTDLFIRLVPPPSYAISYPGGALWQATSCKDTPFVFAVRILFRASDPTTVHLIGEGLDKHPARVEYVRSILADASKA